MTLERYRSHKIVEAGKIQGIRKVGDVVSYVVVGGKQYVVPENFAARGTPEIGDYFVRYPDSDNYLSWSPRAAFESGYTLVDDWVVEQENAMHKIADTVAGAVEHKESVQDKPGDVRLPIEPAKMGAKSSM